MAASVNDIALLNTGVPAQETSALRKEINAELVKIREMIKSKYQMEYQWVATTEAFDTVVDGTLDLALVGAAASPVVTQAGCVAFTLGGNDAITAITNGIEGQLLKMKVLGTGGDLTVTDGATIECLGQANAVLDDTDTIILMLQNGIWTEISQTNVVT